MSARGTATKCRHMSEHWIGCWPQTRPNAVCYDSAITRSLFVSRQQILGLPGMSHYHQTTMGALPLPSKSSPSSISFSLVEGAVDGAPVVLQRKDDVSRVHRLAAPVLAVHNRVPDDAILNPTQTTRAQERAHVRSATRKFFSSPRRSSYTRRVIRFTPARRASRRNDIAEMPWTLSRSLRRCRFAPPWPTPARRSDHPRGEHGRTFQALAAAGRHCDRQGECGMGWEWELEHGSSDRIVGNNHNQSKDNRAPWAIPSQVNPATTACRVHRAASPAPSAGRLAAVGRERGTR